MVAIQSDAGSPHGRTTLAGAWDSSEHQRLARTTPAPASLPAVVSDG